MAHAGAGCAWQTAPCGTHIGAVCEGLSCGRDSTLELWRSVRKQSSRDELSQSDCSSCSPSSLCCSGLGEVEELEMKEWTWTWEEVGLQVRWFGFAFVPHHSTLFLIRSTLFIYLFTLSQVEPVLPMTVTGKWSLSWPMSFSILSSPNIPLKRDNERLTGWASGSKPRSTHNFQNQLQVTVTWSLLKIINSTLLSQN